MKYIYSTIILSLVSFMTFGQSQRLVLLEQFTGASCAPCATWNPTIEDRKADLPGQIISINYQLAPPGNDPMYSHNPTQSGSRAGYYNVTGIPNSVLDGNYFNDFPAGWGTGTVNTRYDVPSPFDIDIIYTVTPETIEVEVTVTASQDFTDSNLRLQTVVVEEEIIFDSSPGTNGEMEFYTVMKRMLPNQNGTNLPSTWTNGESATFNLSWDHSNVYTYTELAVVAFVQNNSSQEIHQSAFSNDAVYDSPFTNAAENSSLANLPNGACTGIELGLEPSISVLNIGTEPLNSLDITATVNGEEFTSSWTGELPLMEEVVISLDEMITTTIDGENDVTVVVSNPNGASNEVEASILDATFESSDLASTTELTLEINFDCWPGEVTWSIENVETGEEIESGGPYGQAQVQGSITENIDLPVNGCYILNLFDSFGDGLNGASAGCPINGSASLTDSQGNELYTVSGSAQWSEQYTPFTADQALSSNDISDIDANLEIYPNPARDVTNFSITLGNSANVTYEVIDVLGKVVELKNVGMLPAGANVLTTDMSALNNGVYIVSFRIGDGRISKKLVVKR